MTPVEASDRRSSFCARLKSERERRATSIAAIADSTKVKASLLEALERGDLSRWPKGIYRRAFFREYVTAIGLPADSFVTEFLDVFAELEPTNGTGGNGNVPTPHVNGSTPQAATPVSFRLLFEEQTASGPASDGGARSRRSRLTAAGSDLAAVAAFAGAVAGLSPLTFVTTALPLLAVASMSSAWLGHGLVEFAWQWAVRARSKSATTTTFVPDPLPDTLSAPSAIATWHARILGTTRGPAMLRHTLERMSEIRIKILDRGRERELASLRQQRVDTANRTTADELFM